MSREASRFFEHADAFCAFVDNVHEIAKDDRVGCAIVLLANLLSSSGDLPRAHGGDAEVLALQAPSFAGFEDVDGYSVVLDPFELAAPDVGIGSLTDDFQDIYLDLKRSILLRETDESAAIAYARLMLWHWGDHATNALSVLHRLRTSRGVTV
jgi:hypothetical protein